MVNITCFGEVLWDVFPTHKKIGGAPLNVAIRLKSLNNNVSIISSVGTDKKGDKLIEFIKEKNINIDGLQVSNQFETGVAQVVLSSKGSASYDLKYPRAWDKIELTNTAIELAKNSNAFIYGSLVARDEVSKKTLYELLNYAKYKIFDVNLRVPYYKKEVLIELMNKADFLKFNDDEIYEISKYLGSKYNSLEQNIFYIAEKTNTKNICVTKGSHGAVLYYNNKLFYNSGYKIKVVDTVGAGDSFLGSLIGKLLNKCEPQEAINFACAVGALVASSEGANPKIEKQTINAFMNP